MIHKSELFSHLDSEKIQAILESCYLQDKSDYTDDERHLFNECRGLIEQGKSSEELDIHFAYRKDLIDVFTPSSQPSQPPSPESKPKKSGKSNRVSLFELNTIK